MKTFFKAYGHFTRREQMGIIALLVLLALLLAIRATMQLWVRPEPGTQKQQELVKAWEEFKAKQDITQALTDTAPAKSRKFAEVAEKPEVVDKPAKQTGGLFLFDPNTIDSTGLRKLGLREKTTSIFLHWRGKGKVFYRKEELKKLYTLTTAEYERLEPYIHIGKRK